MNGTIAACVVALKMFTWPDLSHWRGLPECTFAALEQVFTVPRREGWRGRAVGEETRTLEYLYVTGGGFPDSIRVWLDGDRVAMMDSKVLGRARDLKALTAALGPPAAKLDSLF